MPTKPNSMSRNLEDSTVPMASADHSDPSTLTSPLLPLENPSSGAGDESIGVDEMLRRYAGDFGPWQLRHFVLSSLAWVVYAFHTMVMIFADQDPTDGRRTSTVSEWGLVSGDRYKVGLAQSAFFAGCMLGSAIFGHLSDSFLGRKGALTALCIIDAAFGCFTAFSPSYPSYLILRTLTGVGTGAMGPCTFLLATEPIGPAARATAGMSVFYFFSAGIVALSALAYFVTSWRALYALASLPALLFLVLVLPFVSESPRWHLIRSRPDKALRVMHSIAAKNGRQIPARVSLALDGGKVEAVTSGGGSTIADVIRSPLTRTRLARVVLVDFLCSIVYYGLSLNVTNLNTNIYVSAAANAMAETPAFALTAVLLGRLGRRPLAVGTMWLSGGSCMVGSLVGSQVVRMGCGVVGIFGMAATFNLLLVYAAELFPTEVRSAALGCMQQASQMGAIAAPMVVVGGGRAAMAAFGVCGVVGGVVAVYLPETLDKGLYDTMAGMEEGERGPVKGGARNGFDEDGRTN